MVALPQTVGEVIMFAVNECIGVPLCIVGGEAFVTGEYLRAAVGFGLGVPLCVLGVTFPSWRERLSADTQAAIARQTIRWAPLAIVAAFAYVVGPGVYQRAISPSITIGSPGNMGSDVVAKADYDLLGDKLAKANDEKTVLQQKLERVDQALAVIQQGSAELKAKLAEREQLEQKLAAAQAQLQADKQQLEIAKRAAHQAPPPPPAEDQIPIKWTLDFRSSWSGSPDPRMQRLWFEGQATALAHMTDAYIISNFTGHKERLKVFNPSNLMQGWDANQIEAIASGAHIILGVEWKPRLSTNDFLSQWGAFELHVIYDKKEYTHLFDQEFVLAKMTREMPGEVGPRITPKK